MIEYFFTWMWTCTGMYMHKYLTMSSRLQRVWGWHCCLLRGWVRLRSRIIVAWRSHVQYQILLPLTESLPHAFPNHTTSLCSECIHLYSSHLLLQVGILDIWYSLQYTCMGNLNTHCNHILALSSKRSQHNYTYMYMYMYCQTQFTSTQEIQIMLKWNRYCFIDLSRPVTRAQHSTRWDDACNTVTQHVCTCTLTTIPYQ